LGPLEPLGSLSAPDGAQDQAGPLLAFPSLRPEFWAFCGFPKSPDLNTGEALRPGAGNEVGWPGRGHGGEKMATSSLASTS
jgi:hypothetical protein